MLWSVMPEAVVLAGLDEKISVVDGQVGNCQCKLRVGADGRLAIEQVISTDPTQYLRRDLQPGRQVYIDGKI